MTQHDEPDTASIAAALDAFLAFRETDMELWRRAGNDLGLTMLAMLALARILRAHAAGSPLRQVDLGKRLQISAAGTSQIIDALEERRLVRREPIASDRRAVALVPGAAADPVARDVLDGDAEFTKLAKRISPEGLRAFVHMMRGMEAVSAAKFTG